MYRDVTALLQLLADQEGHVSMTAMNTVADVLNKLLVVGITDSGEFCHTCLQQCIPHVVQ